MKFPLVIILVLLMSSPAYSESVVEVARSQIGKGEIGGNNRGPNVKKYTKGQEVAWCSGFVSWVVNRAGKNDNYFLSARSWLKAKGSKKVTRPKAGDLIVFARGNHAGHVGIVEYVSEGNIHTIEGNVGPYPAKVKRMTYQLGHIKNLIGFVRI